MPYTWLQDTISSVHWKLIKGCETTATTELYLLGIVENIGKSLKILLKFTYSLISSCYH